MATKKYRKKLRRKTFRGGSASKRVESIKSGAAHKVRALGRAVANRFTGKAKDTGAPAANETVSETFPKIYVVNSDFKSTNPAVDLIVGDVLLTNDDITYTLLKNNANLTSIEKEKITKVDNTLFLRNLMRFLVEFTNSDKTKLGQHISTFSERSRSLDIYTKDIFDCVDSNKNGNPVEGSTIVTGEESTKVPGGGTDSLGNGGGAASGGAASGGAESGANGGG